MGAETIGAETIGAETNGAETIGTWAARGSGAICGCACARVFKCVACACVLGCVVSAHVWVSTHTRACGLARARVCIPGRRAREAAPGEQQRPVLCGGWGWVGDGRMAGCMCARVCILRRPRASHARVRALRCPGWLAVLVPTGTARIPPGPNPPANHLPAAVGIGACICGGCMTPGGAGASIVQSSLFAVGVVDSSGPEKKCTS